MIEKHFTNDKKKPGNDHFHSFDKIDLKNYYKKINYLNKVLGSSKKHFLKVKKFQEKMLVEVYFLIRISIKETK